MMADFNISIFDEEVNHQVILPDEKFIEVIKKEVEDTGAVHMKIGNVAHGCDGAVISFGGKTYGDSYNGGDVHGGDVFGFVVSKETLKEIVDSLQFTLDNFNG